MTSLTSLTVEPLGAHVGAEVRGADPAMLGGDAGFADWCLDTLEAHGALVFRDLHLDDAAHVAFSRRLGDVEIKGRGEHPEIMVVSLDPAKTPMADYLRGTVHWHIDGAQDDIPNKATVLNAIAVSATGGETEFASTYAAFDMLDADEQEQALATRVVHSLSATQRLTYPDPTPEQEAQWARVADKVHPLVWTHRTGRRSLVIGATASHVEGMDADEGRALLASLGERATSPERVYRHEWQVGDLVIWDNRGVMHRVCPYDASSAREMHRTTIAGDEPIR
jgi:alpha-ketoglutarate-dependent taurine dioxygenase